jgi:hypothetical protein
MAGRNYTDLYVRAVAQAVASPGQWVKVPRRFASQMNARVTGCCLEGGYLRVKPQGDAAITIRGHRWLRTAAPVAVKVEGAGEEWTLHLCHQP